MSCSDYCLSYLFLHFSVYLYNGMKFKITNLKDKLISCGIGAAVLAVCISFSLPCPFLKIFNIPCAGCGITRAYKALLHFDIKKAFEMNFMFWAVPILLLLYFFDGRLFRQKWLNTLVLVLILAGFFVCWIFKLIKL